MNLRLHIILLWLQFPIVAFGQNGEAEKPDADSAYWRKYVLRLERELPLTDLANSNRNNVLRLWADGQVIEIWQENKSCKGYLIHWAEEVVPYNEEGTGRYFSIKESLDSTECITIARSVITYSIRAIPSGNKIPGWEQGLDGIEYLIESNQTGSYSLKSYWTPSSQNNLKEAESIQNFVNEVRRTINAPNRRKYFEEGIPFNSWTTNGGYASVGKAKTYAEYISMKQERNRYRKLKKRQMQGIK